MGRARFYQNTFQMFDKMKIIVCRGFLAQTLLLVLESNFKNRNDSGERMLLYINFKRKNEIG